MSPKWHEDMLETVLLSSLPMLWLCYFLECSQGKRVILSYCHPNPFFCPLRFVIGVKRLLFWRLVRLGSPQTPGGLPESLFSSCYHQPPKPLTRLYFPFSLAGSPAALTGTVCKEHNNNCPVMWRNQLKTSIFHVAPRWIQRCSRPNLH